MMMRLILSAPEGGCPAHPNGSASVVEQFGVLATPAGDGRYRLGMGSEGDEQRWTSPDPAPADLADEAVAQVHRWLERTPGQGRTPRFDRGRAAARLLSQVLSEPSGLPFTVGFIDQVMRPEDPVTAARSLTRLSRTDCSFLPAPLRLGVRIAGRLAPVAPGLVVRASRMVLRQLVGHLVVDSRPVMLGRSLRRLRGDGVRLNLNLLGEAVLGDREAAERLSGIERLLARPDVDYVSVKISSVVNQLDLWAHDQTVARVADRLSPLFQLAADSADQKFINLDMEEYHDLDLTIDVFTALLDRPEFLHLEAGIVIQAYLPDALAAVQRLTRWAERRAAAGGAGIKIRLVKGANLPMEKVDAERHGWAQAPWGSKVATDANYKRVLDWALTPDRTRSVRYGIAGHNLFDIALARGLAAGRGVSDRVEFEMLAGMAPDQVERIKQDVGGVLLYTPVVHPDHFDVAISYLVRRLEENAAEENFMSAVFDIGDDETLFAREEERFRAAVAAATRIVPDPERHQTPDRVPEGPGFTWSTDSDPALPVNRSWARDVAAAMPGCRLGTTTLNTHRVETADQVDAAMIAVDEADEAGRELSDAQASYLSERFGPSDTPDQLTVFDAAIATAAGRLAEDRSTAQKTLTAQRDQLRRTLENFLDNWPNPNLRADPDTSVGDFERILDDLETSGLHELEAEWKNSLVTMSGNDLTNLASALSRARREIQERIEPINQIMRELPFYDDDHRLQISPRDNQSESRRKFLKDLRDVRGLIESSSTSPADSPERAQAYERMSRLINRIRRTAPDFDGLIDVRNHVRVSAEKIHATTGAHVALYDHIGEKSGGESQELIAFIVGAALRYQLGDASAERPRYAPVFLDEALIKADAHFTARAIGAWRGLGFQLVIGAPIDKYSAIEPHIDVEYDILKDTSGRSWAKPKVGV